MMMVMLFCSAPTSAIHLVRRSSKPAADDDTQIGCEITKSMTSNVPLASFSAL
jgi:hypothetical protein